MQTKQFKLIAQCAQNYKAKEERNSSFELLFSAKSTAERNWLSCLWQKLFLVLFHSLLYK
jgi:hypothetical protein